MEIWKDIPGLEGKYKVSNYGRIKSIRTKPQRVRYGRVYKPEIIRLLSCDERGYKQTCLSIRGKQKTYKVHKLVWDAFGEGKRNGRTITVDHIDGIKSNNHIDNLQLLSNRDNKIKGVKRDGIPTGAFLSGKKWYAKIYINGKYKHLGAFVTMDEAGDAYLKAKESL